MKEEEYVCPVPKHRDSSMVFGGIERDAKWIDENYLKIPNDPMLEIRNAIEDICNRYIKSEYANEDSIIKCKRWLTACRIDKDYDDELL